MSAVGSALVSNTWGTLQLIFSHHFMQPVYISGMENATCWFLKYCSCLRYKPCLLSAMDWQPLLKHRERSWAGAGPEQGGTSSGPALPLRMGTWVPSGHGGVPAVGSGMRAPTAPALWASPAPGTCQTPAENFPAQKLWGAATDEPNQPL